MDAKRQVNSDMTGSAYLQRLVRGDPEVEAHFAAYLGELVGDHVRMSIREPKQVVSAQDETMRRVLTALRAQSPTKALGVLVRSVCHEVIEEMASQGEGVAVSEGASEDNCKDRIVEERRQLLESQFDGTLSPRQDVRLKELDRALAAIELKEADEFDAQYDSSRAGQIEAALDRVEGYLEELKARSR